MDHVKNKKKRPRGRKKKEEFSCFFVCFCTSKMSKDFLDSLSFDKNYTNVIIKLSHKEKVQRERERESVKPEAFM